MRAEVKEKWDEALRSGDYQQGQGNLRYTQEGVDYFCCLGVLCDLAVKDGVEITVGRPPSGGMAWSYDQTLSYLPDAVARWAGLPVNGEFVSATQSALARMNDDGKSFHEIADYIEENL